MKTLTLAGLLVLTTATASSANDAVIAALEEPRFQTPPSKGRQEQVQGKSGAATRFQFEADARSTFFTSNIHGTPEWDQAEGFSFWVKGEGVDGFGGLEFIYDDDYSVRYDLAFPIHGTDWKKITVAWKDLIPVLPGARSLPLAVSGPNRPSRFSGLWVGKWWYWGDYPELTFALDEIRLEPKVPRDPKCAQPEGRPLDRVLKKLEAGQPITIVTMGDSLTDKRHWANREAAWVDLLKARLEKTYQTKVTMVNVAIGGTQLRQNLVLIPRWIDQCPEPDLVTIGFGFNDWDAGMRAEEFKRGCREAIDRIRCATRGHADVLLMTTNPASIRWNEMEELASACREAARDSRAGLADTDRAFLQAGETDRDSLFVRDGVHLSQAGHALVAETVFRSLESRDP